MLHEFINLNRDDILARCRAKVATRLIPAPTESEINHGLPLFLDQLTHVLRHHEVSDPAIGRSAALNGQDLLNSGFTVGQVVHSYGDICQSITELAIDTNAPINAEEFRTLNRCLDDAIAAAVTAYGHDRDESAHTDDIARGSQELGYFVHELRNLIQASTIAFEVLKDGNVGFAGSTAAVLHRNLLALATLVDKSIAGMRLTNGIQHPAVFSVSTFVEELALAAWVLGARHGVSLKVESVEDGAEILGDPHTLAAAIRNLLQNAAKFTRPGSTVTLRTVVSGDRIAFEVQDECGGSPDGQDTELFHPFKQRWSDRNGLGLGLAYSQWAVVANGGRLYVRDLPGSGCIFVAELPKYIHHFAAQGTPS